MSNIGKEFERLKFDKRLTDWNIKHNRLSKAELDQHLQALPDLSANTEKLVISDDYSGSNGHDTGHMPQ